MMCPFHSHIACFICQQQTTMKVAILAALVASASAFAPTTVTAIVVVGVERGF
jgi:hypothetical protein